MSKFVHMELSTSDPEAAQKFYKAIFGWKYTKMKMADGSVYVGFDHGDGTGGGIQKSQDPNVPPHWLPYAGVDSIKKTTAKVEKSGGKVLLPQMPVDEMGWIAIFADPQGAVFGVWQSSVRPPEAAPAAEPAPAEAAPVKAGKKTAKKAGGKKAAKQESAEQDAAAAAPVKAGKKTAKKAGGKKAAKKQAAAPEQPAAPAKKKAAKKKTTKKG